MSAKTVFISYRRDAIGKAFARSLKQELTHRGYDAFLDVDSIDAGKWQEQILTQVPARAHFLLLLTPGALDRCEDENDWVRREFELAVRSKRNIVPVREESVDLTKLRETCPESMKDVFAYQIATVRSASFESDVEELIDRYIPPHMAPTFIQVSAARFHADISRIVKYAPAELVGREDETKLLNHAWAKVQNQEPKRPHVLVFVALGGEGKTSLIAKWVAELAHNGWSGCDAAFAWSFYHQGTDEKTADSSDLFLKEAITFFGDEVDQQFAASNAGAFEKGQRLARIVSQRRNLLILDGVEPLQYASTSPISGELKDAGLAALLKGLATGSEGLCVVTTRYSIPDLKGFWQTSALEKKLLRLSRDAGVHLLKTLGVKGAPSEFEALVEDVKGHALTLNMLGTYLRDAHAGDIRKRDLVKLEEADLEEQAGHAFHVMDAYVKSFESEGKNGKRALETLQLLGLFDRPASADCLKALLKAPRIPDLTETLVGTSDAQRNLIFARLESARLLTVNRDAPGMLISLDAHPLLRDYFAKDLRTRHPGAWRAAHRRLYKHLIATTHEGGQPTLEDLQPLYQAVGHGCQAGLEQEARDNVYIARIHRHGEFYSTYKLGAFGADLGAAASFFKTPWVVVSPSLDEASQAWILGVAAFNLKAVGRLLEALETYRATLAFMERLEAWTQASIAAGNLSVVKLTLGDIFGAISDAAQSVTYADRCGDMFQGSSRRADHADAQHQAGHRAEAEARFREAEQMQAEREDSYPILYSLRGFQYCSLLLAEAERVAWCETQKSEDRIQRSDLLNTCQAVVDRAVQTLNWYELNKQQWLQDIGLDHLTIGRALLYEAILKGDQTFTALHSSNDEAVSNNDENTSGLNTVLRSAATEIAAAVASLRRAGEQRHIPHGLNIRAWLRFLDGKLTGAESAQADLDEAWEIAERGSMRLFMADIHLYRARLFHGVKPYPWTSAQEDLAAARRLIEQCGYWRRKEELEDAEAAAKNW
jgi:hypothetical protein